MAIKKSRLAEIYKSEKTKGGGIASTLGKRFVEKIDPRQIFNQSGFLAAALPSMFKAYSATPTGAANKITATPTRESMVSEAMNSKLDELNSRTKDVVVNTQLSAKNSLVLPMMARDMNLMRQNITKLVKIQGEGKVGGEPAYKADMFFKRAGERESEYESKFGKARSTFPTPVAGKKEEGGGLFGMLSMLFAPLLGIGKTIIGAITSTLGGIGEFLLKGITSVFSVDNIIKALGLGGSVIGKIVEFLGAIVKSPIFLALAAGATLFQIAKMLREEYDEKEQRYMDLAKKKKEQGGLSADEEAELRKLNSEKLQQAAREKLGYDPILNKETSKTRVQAVTGETNAARVALQDEAAMQLRTEYEQAGKNPNLITNEEIVKRAEELEKLRTPVPDDGSYGAAESRRFRQTETGEGRLSRLGISPSAVEGGRGMVNPPSVSPTPVTEESLTVQTGPNGEFKNKQEFLTAMYPLAVKASEKLGGVDPNALLTQWGVESAWGTKTSGKFNYFGIKADKSWGGPKEDVMTSEFIGGEKVRIPQPFRSYSSPEEAVDDYVSFLKTNKRYEKAGVFQAQTSSDFFSALQKAGYATDPEYAAKLTRISETTAKQTASLSSSPMMTASLSAPTMTVPPAKPAAGPMIAAATTEVAKERMQLASAPVIISAPTTNNVQSPARNQQAYTQPSVVDSEFMKLLVGRTVTI